MSKLLLVVIVLISFIGCAGMDMPTPKQIITHPLGTIPLHTGMTKNQIIEMWGKPSVVKPITPTGTAKFLEAKEEWIYYGNYSKSPLDAGYMSRTKHLFFDGNNLTSWKEEE